MCGNCSYVERHHNVAPDDPLLVRCSRQPATHLRNPTPPPGARARRARLLAEHEDFSIHAATTAGPHDPSALERLCRYMARPPIPQGRLERLLDGRIAFRLKRRRRGGQLVFTPDAFLARLAALIPRPMSNQTLYFGALATASGARPHVLPPPPCSTPQRPTAPERPARMAHADLLRRVFVIDLHQCPCGGRLHLVAVINNPDVHQAVAAAIIVSDQRPPRAPPPRPRH